MIIRKRWFVLAIITFAAAYVLLTQPITLLVWEFNYYRFNTTQAIARVRRLQYVFVGDSLTANVYYWGTRMGGSPFSAVNLAVSGHTISQIEPQLDEAARLRPRYVSVLAGTNDYSFGRSDQQILGDFRSFLQRAHDLGLSPVIVTSIPVHAQTADDARLIDLNQDLRKLVEAHHFRFLDLNASILERRDRATLYWSDGIHFSPQMYELWTEKLRNLFNQSGEAGHQ